MKGTGRRVAVVGDLAGHLTELQAELALLGAEPATGRLPDDLTVVQVGDLVHRGPDSDGVVALVDRYLREQPGQWVQLAGNHEGQYLRPPVFAWRETIGEDASATLCRWWADGSMRAAAVVRTPQEDFLVTHAGLTAQFWRQALDAQPDAVLAAAAINSFIGVHEDVLFHAGAHLGGGKPDFTAGPIWANAALELVPSWLADDADLPFSQIHGHSTIVDWWRSEGLDLSLQGDELLADLLTVDLEAAHETVTLPGGRIVGVDPRHTRTPRHPWRAFVLDDAHLVG